MTVGRDNVLTSTTGSGQIGYTLSSTEKDPTTVAKQTLTNDNKSLPLFVHITDEQWKEGGVGSYEGTLTFVAEAAQ